MSRAHWSDALKVYSPCSDALAWARTQPSAAVAWRACKRGDWMLWLLGKQSRSPGSGARRPLVLAACACARLALPYVLAGENRHRIAIETAEAWARGDGVTIAQVRKAADAADAAAADAAYAAYAAYAAAYAAEVAEVAAEAARRKILAQCADLVRQHYQRPPRLRSYFSAPAPSPIARRP